jgi:hypothetical protein
MSGSHDAAKDLLATKAAAERYMAAAIDAARTLGYREGLAIGRKAGAVEQLRAEVRYWEGAARAAVVDAKVRDIAASTAERLKRDADDIESGEATA